jgi:aspartate racemase
MHIGMIVGIGPAATDFYYRRLIGALAQKGLPLELTMAHADTPTLLRNQTAGDTDAQVAIYMRLTQRLQVAGARALAVTSIAGHFCIQPFERVSPLPVINLLGEVDKAITSRGLRRLGILGTRVVMETQFYGAARTAKIVAPAGDTLQAVHDAYVAMAASGRVSDAQREVFFAAGRAMVADQGAEAVMLGGTDLALAFGGQDPGFAILDCAAIHADAIAEAAAA